MKNQFLVAVAILFSSLYAVGQSPICDAIKLRKLKVATVGDKLKFTNKDSIRLTEILLPYAPNATNYLSLITAFDDNPYFGLSAITALSTKDKEKLGSLGGLATKGLNAVGGMDVTNIADGLAKLMVERTKQELNAYFFDRFNQEVKKNKELQILFPQTSQLLMAMGDKVYNYSAYLAGLREAFELDLSKLFVNFPKVLEEEKFAKSFAKMPELKIILATSFYFIAQLNSGVHPGEVVHGLPDFLDHYTISQNVKASIKTIDLFSQSLRSNNADNYWITRDSLKFLNDEMTMRLYLGLVYQSMVRVNDTITFIGKDNKKIDFKDSVLYKIGVNWEKEKKSYQSIRKFVQGFAEQATLVSVHLRNLKAPDANYLQTYAFAESSIGLLSYSTQALQLEIVRDFISNEQRKKDSILVLTFIGLAKNGSSLYYNCNVRNYGAAVSNCLSIADFIKSETSGLVSIQKRLAEISANQKSGDKEALKTERKQLEASAEEINTDPTFDFMGLVLKYGNFMAAVVQAKSSEEVKVIIESVALPAGSSRIKRESNFNIAVNSYVGVFAGHEWIKGVQNNVYINNYALSAPIGISFSKGGLFRSRKSKPGWSLGGFFSFVDIGALASFRFGDDSSATVSKIELKQIVAPGAFVSIGFPKCPVSLNIGAQYGPLLRKVSTTANTNLDNGYWRFGANLAIDIPLFNLYNTERKRR